MTQDDPAKRPKIDVAVARLDSIIKSLGTWKLQTRASRRSDPPGTVRMRNLKHIRQRIVFAISRTPAVPSPAPAKPQDKTKKATLVTSTEMPPTGTAAQPVAS